MLNNVRILILEDEPLIAMELAELISNAGGTVVASTRTVRDALDFASQASIDIALLDVHLGSETSLDVAEKLKGLGIPFLLCTGDGKDHVHFANWPSVPVIVKPYKSGVVVEALSLLIQAELGPGTA